MPTNGNGWTKWTAGILATLVILIALPTMAKGIIDNDRQNTRDHVLIRNEFNEKVDEIKDITTDIRLIQREQIVMQKTILERLPR